MNKGLKKGLKITGVTVAVILVFMLVLPFVFKDKVITIVKKEANEMLNAKLDFESLDISLFSHFPSASIELNGLTLSGIDDFENDTLVSAESIDVAVNVMSLFSDKGFDVNYVVLDKPSIKAVKLADGRVNWDIMKPDTVDVEEEKTVEVEGESSFRLKLKNFKIVDATIVYVDDSTNMQFYTDKLNLKLSGDMSADMTDIDSKLSCKDIYFAMGGISYLKQAEAGAKLTVSADLKNNKFILKENTLSLNAIVLNLDGWVALLDDGAMDMDLKINTSEINFKEILSLIPAIYQNNFDKLRTTGNMSLTAFAKGRMAGENMPQFGLTLGVKDATLNYEGMPASVDGINIGASVSNPGGSLDAVVDIAGMMLPKGIIVYTEDKYGSRTDYNCEGDKQLEVPMTVLVNGNSASASEILAGAIKDYGIDEKDFLDRLDDMVEQAFDDQCTGTNPRYPLMSEIKQMYLNAYYGTHKTV